MGDDEAVLVLPFRPELATMGDVVHGGAISTLIDTAGMAAAWADDIEPETLAGSTIGLTVDFLAAARGATSPPARACCAAAEASASAKST